MYHFAWILQNRKETTVIGVLTTGGGIGNDFNVILYAVIGKVEVVVVGGEFSCYSVDLLHFRENVQLLEDETLTTKYSRAPWGWEVNLAGLPNHKLSGVEELGNLLVREAKLLSM